MKQYIRCSFNRNKQNLISGSHDKYYPMELEKRLGSEKTLALKCLLAIVSKEFDSIEIKSHKKLIKVEISERSKNLRKNVDNLVVFNKWTERYEYTSDYLQRKYVQIPNYEDLENLSDEEYFSEAAYQAIKLFIDSENVRFVETRGISSFILMLEYIYSRKLNKNMMGSFYKYLLQIHKSKNEEEKECLKDIPSLLNYKFQEYINDIISPIIEQNDKNFNYFKINGKTSLFSLFFPLLLKHELHKNNGGNNTDLVWYGDMTIMFEDITKISKIIISEIHNDLEVKRKKRLPHEEYDYIIQKIKNNLEETANAYKLEPMPKRILEKISTYDLMKGKSGNCIEENNTEIKSIFLSEEEIKEKIKENTLVTVITKVYDFYALNYIDNQTENSLLDLLYFKDGIIKCEELLRTLLDRKRVSDEKESKHRIVNKTIKYMSNLDPLFTWIYGNSLISNPPTKVIYRNYINRNVNERTEYCVEYNDYFIRDIPVTLACVSLKDLENCMEYLCPDIVSDLNKTVDILWSRFMPKSFQDKIIYDVNEKVKNTIANILSEIFDFMKEGNYYVLIQDLVNESELYPKELYKNN